MTSDLRSHWESVHSKKAVDGVSWWQEPGDLWLDLVDLVGLGPSDRIADIGSGSSVLVDALADRGFTDLLAIDVSESALDRIRARRGQHPGLTLIAADARHLRLEPRVRLWHDRAVFHFLTDPSDRDAYREALHESLLPGGTAIVATFADDGPQTCSGLPVQRYTPGELVAALGFAAADVMRSERRIHVTPWGSQQPFTIVVVRSPMPDSPAGPEA